MRQQLADAERRREAAKMEKKKGKTYVRQPLDYEQVTDFGPTTTVPKSLRRNQTRK